VAPKSATHLSRGWCAAGVVGPASMALSSTLPVVRSTTPASRSRRRRVVGGSAFPAASKTKRIRTRSSLPTSKCSWVQKHKPKLIYSRHCKSNRLLCSMRKGATCENFQILDSRLHLRQDFLPCPRARRFLRANYRTEYATTTHAHTASRYSGASGGAAEGKIRD